MIQTTKFSFFFVVLIFVFFSSSAQDEQARYLKAKEYLRDGNYVFAMDYFRKLAGDNQNHPFTEHASYYYALSAYKNGDTGLAKSMWLQMEAKQGKWAQIDEVRYWLSKVYFEEGNFKQGVLYAKKSNLSTASGLEFEYLSKVDSLGQLEYLYRSYPNDKIIGNLLADLINQQPISTRNFQLLNQLVVKFDLNKVVYGLPEIGKSQIKSSYNIAVLLPFLFDGLDNSRRVERNKFVMELYQGMLMAVDSLQVEGKYLNIYPYDTKRSAETTAEIFEKPELKSMDLIVGPLFPDPSAVANDFSLYNKINIINPLVSNSSIVKNNPYSFLYKSDIETQAIRAAEFAIENFKNKNTLIYYENNEKDSLSAYTYSQKLQEKGFDVLANQAVVGSTVKFVYEMLTEVYEVKYDRWEADSVRELGEERIVKKRKSVREKDEVVYYEKFFRIAPDSIGHIYVATSKALIASNFISAQSIRDDSTKIIGRGIWRDFQTLTFEELERLDVYFIDPKFINKDSENYVNYRQSYMSVYKTEPSFNAIIGYDMMYYLGSMMKKYGHYFQKGNPTVGFVPGQLLYGTDFGFQNSNQCVPITVLSESKLKVVNEKQNE